MACSSFLVHLDSSDYPDSRDCSGFLDSLDFRNSTDCPSFLDCQNLEDSKDYPCFLDSLDFLNSRDCPSFLNRLGSLDFPSPRDYPNFLDHSETLYLLETTDFRTFQECPILLDCSEHLDSSCLMDSTDFPNSLDCRDLPGRLVVQKKVHRMENRKEFREVQIDRRVYSHNCRKYRECIRLVILGDYMLPRDFDKRGFLAQEHSSRGQHRWNLDCSLTQV